eukprot:2450942-Alexandrium_andersonii.AAC.1
MVDTRSPGDPGPGGARQSGRRRRRARHGTPAVPHEAGSLRAGGSPSGRASGTDAAEASPSPPHYDRDADNG